MQVKHSVACPWLEYFEVEASNVTRKEEAAVRSRFFTDTPLLQPGVSFVRVCINLEQSQVRKTKETVGS